MNLKYQLMVAFIISVVSLLGFSSIAFLVSGQQVNRFDHYIIHYIQELESPVLTGIMKFFTFVGSVPVVIVLSLLVLFFLYKVLNHRRELILLVVAIAGSALLNQFLKWLFQRARPDLNRLIEVGGYSFPSGHAMNAFTVYGILTFLLWRHIPYNWGRVILILFSTMMILAIGTSRIYLGVHYPSDIIGGYFASGCWLACAIWFFKNTRTKDTDSNLPRKIAKEDIGEAAFLP